jgi:hypothetical protein
VVAYEANDEVHARSGAAAGGVIAFGAALPLSLPAGTGSNYQSDDPQLIASGSTVLACWRTEFAGTRTVYVSRSNDGGSTWLAPSDARSMTGSVRGALSEALNRDYFVTLQTLAATQLGPNAHLFWMPSGLSLPEFRSTQIFGTRLYGTPQGVTLPLVTPGAGHGATLGSTIASETMVSTAGSYAMLWFLGTGRGPLDLSFIENCSGLIGNISSYYYSEGDISSLGSPAQFSTPIPSSTSFLGSQHSITAIVLNGAPSGCALDSANGMDITVY